MLEYNTGAAKRMAPATDRLFQAAHVGNAIAKPTPLGDLVSKDKKGSPRKIDAAVAAIIAFDRAAWFRANRGGPSGRRVVTA